MSKYIAVCLLLMAGCTHTEIEWLTCYRDEIRHNRFVTDSCILRPIINLKESHGKDPKGRGADD